MNLEQVADELYALAPAAFTAARDEQARRARASGDADLAGTIKKLRRPTVSAWLVNLLAREDGGQVDALLELGQSLREAHETKEAVRARREAEAAERARQEAEAAERNRQDAAEDVREAQAGLDEAEQEVTSARDKHQALQRRIDELERQLDQIQEESAQA